jgi:hypothetical protein
MPKKQHLILLMLIVLLVAGGIISGVYFWQKNNHQPVACTTEAKICPDGSSVGRTGPNCKFAACPVVNNCANEGDKVRESGAGFPTKCCSNLKPMYGYAREDCSLPGIEGDIGKCSNCGNDICETKNNENKCNCPEDCSAQLDTSGWQTYVNVEYGFEFKFPKSFSAEIWRASNWPPLATVVPASEDLVKTGCPDIQAGALPLDHSQVTLNGINFTLYKESEGAAGSTYTTYCYATPKGQNNYVIEFVMRYTSGCGESCGPYCGTPNEALCQNFDKVKEVEQPIEQMVSTFRFTK